MCKKIAKQIIMINAMRYLKFLQDTFQDDSIHEFNCLVFEAEYALKSIQNINKYNLMGWNKKTFIEQYVALRKLINLPEFRNAIFDIDDLTLFGGVLNFKSEYKRNKRDYANGIIQ